jgi:hypothetical protein
MQEAAAKRQAMRIERNAVGGPATRQAIYDATKTPENFVPKVNGRGGPTVGETVANLPEGTDVIALQDNVFRRSESPPNVDSPAMLSAKRISEQTANIDALKVKRNEVTAPMRERALSTAGPVDAVALNEKLTSLIENPENAAKPVQSLLRGLRNNLADKTDARSLYAVRKYINDINKGLTENSRSIKQYAGTQLKQVREIIDTAIENSGAQGWRDYLNTYAEFSKKIDADLARREAAKTPLQRSTIESTDTPAGIAGGGTVQLWSRPVSIANSLLRKAGKDVPANVLAALVDDLLNPEKFAENIKPAQIIESRRLGNALIKRYGLAQPAVMGNALTQPKQNELRGQP